MSVTLDDLKQHVGVTDKQLNLPCTNEHIRDIALEVPDWQLFGAYLGLSSAVLDGIDDDYNKHQQKTLKMLEAWKRNSSIKATYRTLTGVCLKLRNADLAEKVCRCAKVVQPGAAIGGSNKSGSLPPGGGGEVQPVSKSKLDEKPRLAKLLKLRGNGEEVSVIKMVAPEWKQFGVSMDFDESGEQLDLFAADETLKKPVDRCQKMFQHWMNGNGIKPMTWRTLTGLLRDNKKEIVAEKIESILSSGPGVAVAPSSQQCTSTSSPSSGATGYQPHTRYSLPGGSATTTTKTQENLLPGKHPQSAPVLPSSQQPFFPSDIPAESQCPDNVATMESDHHESIDDQTPQAVTKEESLPPAVDKEDSLPLSAPIPKQENLLPGKHLESASILSSSQQPSFQSDIQDQAGSHCQDSMQTMESYHHESIGDRIPPAVTKDDSLPSSAPRIPIQETRSPGGDQPPSSPSHPPDQQPAVSAPLDNDLLTGVAMQEDVHIDRHEAESIESLSQAQQHHQPPVEASLGSDQPTGLARQEEAQNPPRDPPPSSLEQARSMPNQSANEMSELAIGTQRPAPRPPNMTVHDKNVDNQSARADGGGPGDSGI